MSKYPSDLTALIAFLKKFPGVGSKTAERFAFQLLTWQEDQLGQFSDLIGTIKIKIKHCPECGCLMEPAFCTFCDKDKRDARYFCIISCAKDAYALEETRAYRGLYHVIGGLLSPLDGRTPEHLQLERLKERVLALNIQEVIIAIDSTLEGDATALYLKNQLNSWGLSVSRLAFGIPMGSTLDFVDGGTLAKAFTGRQTF